MNTNGGDKINSIASLEQSIDSKESQSKPSLEKNFGWWSLFAASFSLTCSWVGVSASFGTSIGSGGAIIIIYGLMIAGFFSLCVAITLGELISAYTNPAGQYYWTLQLAPERYRKVLAFITALFSYFGCVFTCASVSSSLANSILSLYVLNNPSFEIKRWHSFVTFEAINLALSVFNIWGRYLPHIFASGLWISLLGFVVTMITCLACSSGRYNLGNFVFSDYTNITGWNNKPLSFIIGLISPIWCFAGLDSAVHMVDDLGVKAGKVLIPRAVICTVVLGFLTAFAYSVAIFFCATDISEVVESTLPLLTIFYQSTRNKGAAIFLEVLTILTGIICNISAHAWQARVCWTMAGSEALPGSKYLKQIHPRTKLPVNAHFFSTFLVAAIGCIYMGSTTAFNAIITGCICLLLLSYSIPALLLLRVRNKGFAHGPFWCGKLGYIANILTILWTLFCLVFLSFPYVRPVTSTNMNYVSAVYGGAILAVIICWFLYGKSRFIANKSEI
ncbi:MAG: amino acid permease [Asgard group archaeon]|nr:amino acid permease [Asgard group archaeon]